MNAPLKILGASGATRTVSRASRDRMGGAASVNNVLDSYHILNSAVS